MLSIIGIGKGLEARIVASFAVSNEDYVFSVLLYGYFMRK